MELNEASSIGRHIELDVKGALSPKSRQLGQGRPGRPGRPGVRSNLHISLQKL